MCGCVTVNANFLHAVAQKLQNPEVGTCNASAVPYENGVLVSFFGKIYS